MAGNESGRKCLDSALFLLPLRAYVGSRNRSVPMLTAAISTIALALALGPHLQVGLQAVVSESQAPIETPAAPADAAPEILETVEMRPLIEAPVQVGPSEAEPEIILAQADPVPTQTESNPAPTRDATIESPEPVEVQPQSGELPQSEWSAALMRASSALSAAKTAKGNFVQTNADGTTSTGEFALNRPGRMRFDYDEPTPVLIVSDGTTVAMEDRDLETVDRVPIGSTPLGLILSTNLSVNEDVTVLSVMQNEDRLGIRVEDARGELEGTLTMVFNKQSYALLGWLATDGNLQTTVVDLVDVETNVRVDPRLFRLDEDDDEEEER